MTQVPTDRDRLLALSDDELLRLCRVERTRGSGRGGQKRNRTETSVRVVLAGSDLAAESDATRSQATNRRLALRLLRRELAVRCRCPPPAGPVAGEPPGQREARYPLWVALALDVLRARGYRVSEAAADLGLSTGRLVRHLAEDGRLWQQVNEGRREHQLPPLRVG